MHISLDTQMGVDKKVVEANRNIDLVQVDLNGDEGGKVLFCWTRNLIMMRFYVYYLLGEC